MSEYQYAFRDNAKGVSEKGDVYYVSISDAMEEYVFKNHVLPIVESLKNKKLFIDIGSGEGRYSEYFGKYFKHITAVEPDEHRFNQTKKYLEKLDNVTCIHGTTSGIPRLGDIVIVAKKVC